MATILRPTMRARVDSNPSGSATKHVTMAAANPFEREVLRVRSANTPRDMLPGMGEVGDVFDDIKAMTAQAQAQVAAGTQQAAQPSIWAKLGDTLLNVGGQWAVSAIQTDQAKDLAKIEAKRLQAAGTSTLHAPSVHALPVGMPAPQPSRLPSILPWAIGGVAVLAVGAIVLKGRKGSSGGRRRSPRRTSRRRR